MGRSNGDLHLGCPGLAIPRGVDFDFWHCREGDRASVASVWLEAKDHGNKGQVVLVAGVKTTEVCIYSRRLSSRND